MAKLPVPSTSFVGRAQDVQTSISLMERQDVRFLVMTGPPGVGKTRLALAVAAAVADRFPDGVEFVDLAPLTRAEQLLPAIASELTLPEIKETSPADRLIPYLRTRRLLLVLDNVETVAAAATDLEPVVALCPRVKMLVTSRVRLGVKGEQPYAVDPLPLPLAHNGATAGRVLEADAVRLFVERAGDADPSFDPTAAALKSIVAICRHLEGLPLAIELAAARLDGRPPAELLAEVDERLAVLTDGPEEAPDRLRTMRNAVAWSYDLLAPELKALFRRLGVFRGGFTAAAAEAVADAPFAGTPGAAPRRSLADVPLSMFYRLSALVDQSLLMPAAPADSDRFVMLDVTREFALEQLAATGELATVRLAHAEYMAQLGEQTRPQVFTRRYKEAIGTLIREQHNVRAALSWAQERNDAGLSLRLCNGLWEFWYQCGFIAEGRAWVRPALATGGGSLEERFWGLMLAALLAWLQDDDDEARERLDEVLSLAEGDEWGTAAAYNFLALVAWHAGDAGEMIRLASAAHPVMHESGDTIGEAIALLNLAIAAHIRRRFEEALALFDQARQLSDQIGFLWTTAAAGFGCGEAALDLQREAEAVRYFRGSLAITADLGDRWGIGAAVGGLACVAARRGEVEQAARLFAAADALLASGRTFLPTLDRTRYNELRRRVERQCGRRAYAKHSKVGRGWTIVEVVAEANRIAPDPAAPGRLDNPVRLSPKQLDVMKLLVEGKTSKEIASAMGVSKNAVDGHIQAIHRKLGVHNRAEAIARVFQLELLS